MIEMNVKQYTSVLLDYLSLDPDIQELIINLIRYLRTLKEKEENKENE